MELQLAHRVYNHKNKRRINNYSRVLWAFYHGRYYWGVSDVVQRGVWRFHGIPIARKTAQGRIDVNWQDGMFDCFKLLHRFRAISMFLGQPVPLIEPGWVLLKPGFPVARVPIADFPKYARQIFYTESGFNVEESVFSGILLLQRNGLFRREEWVHQYPGQSLIWDICKSIPVDWGDSGAYWI